MKTSVADQLRLKLLNAHWEHGERLPNELALARTFRVGRNAIREAVAQLTAERFVEIRPGIGTIAREWLSNVSLDAFSLVLNINRETPRGRQLLEQLLWLRRTLYRQLAELLISGEPDIERLRSVVRKIMFGDHGRYFWNDLPAMLASEEDVFTRLAFVSGNVPATLLACAINRILLHLIPKMDEPPELDSAEDRFNELIEAIARKDSDRTIALLDELCRLREQTYLDLLNAEPAVQPATPS